MFGEMASVARQASLICFEKPVPLKVRVSWKTDPSEGKVVCCGLQMQVLLSDRLLRVQRPPATNQESREPKVTVP